MTTFTRYDIYKGDERHTHGLLSGIDHVPMREDTAWDELRDVFFIFNEELPIPSYWRLGSKRTVNRAYFTESGYEYFGKHVERLAEIINENAVEGWSVRKRVEAVPEHRILYKDEFQIVAYAPEEFDQETEEDIHDDF